VDIVETTLPGCHELRARVLGDARGSFVKTYVRDQFEQAGLRTDWREEYHSVSARGVIRGMHFQTPPHDHAKTVFCVAGEVTDVVLDLRTGSPSFGRHASFVLSATNGVGLYIPSGCAHGFTSRSESATMTYKVTSVHAPAHDAGVAYDSFGFDWQVADPVLSDRDSRHSPYATFAPVFAFDPERPAW
jgi:dTDP-4-dehydrorhamnose 3,5-epimerase